MRWQIPLLAATAGFAIVMGCSSQSSPPASSCACTVDGGLFEPPPPPDATTPTITCSPATVPAFTPSTIKPLVKHVCTDAQIHAIATACSVNVPGSDACSRALTDPANETCVSGHCLSTPYSRLPVLAGTDPIPPAEGPWGPHIQIFEFDPTIGFGLGFTEINVGGCIALMDPSRLDCADKANARLQCDTIACTRSCMPTTPGSQTGDLAQAVADCKGKAEALPNACQTYVNLDDFCQSELEKNNSPAAFCHTDLQSSDPAVIIAATEKLMKLQCGLPADGSVCVPQSASAFQPPPLIPALSQKVCSDAQLQAYAAACAGPAATANACNQWTGDAANNACRGCLVSSYSSTKATPGAGSAPPPTGPWGPVVHVEDAQGGQYTLYNTAGCVLAKDPTQQPCALAWQAMQTCEMAMCASSCALPNPNGADAATAAARFQSCVDAADTSLCQGYYDSAYQACAHVLEGNYIDLGASASPATFCMSEALSSTDAATANAAYAAFLGAQCHN